MFALEINFHDGVSTPEILLVRRPNALVGSSDYAHVVIEGGGTHLAGLRLTRGLGREFRCQPVNRSEGKGLNPFQESSYFHEAEINLGDVTTHITSLDIDMQLGVGESPDRAGVRILRRALSMPAPVFPAVAVLGVPPLLLSFPVDEPVLVGRSRRCGLRLDASDVSSEHARVGYEAGRFWVEDLGSSNGTFVSKQRVSGRRYLDRGELISIGAEFSIAGIMSRDDVAALGSYAVETPAVGVSKAQFPAVVSTSDIIRPTRLAINAGTTITVGRDPANDIWIGASHISRSHAEISFDENGEVFITDTSSNGTNVDGERLPRGSQMQLVPGLRLVDLGGGVTLAVCFSTADEDEFNSRKRTPELRQMDRPDVVPAAFVPEDSEDAERDEFSTSFAVPAVTDTPPKPTGQQGVFERLAQRASVRSTQIRKEPESNALDTGRYLSELARESAAQTEAESVEDFDEYPSGMGRFGKLILWGMLVVLALVVLGLFVWVLGGDTAHF